MAMKERASPLGCRLLLMGALLVLLMDWGCDMYGTVPSNLGFSFMDGNGNQSRLKTPIAVKLYLDRPPGVGQPDDD